MEFRIPLERVEVRTSRSSGPGGQNVNKVASRVEVRFPVDGADWIPAPVRSRLRELFPSRITASGDLRVVSDRFRDQKRNLSDCLERIQGLLQAAAHRPRQRIATRPTGGSKRRRLEEKKRRGELKRGRGQGEVDS